MEQKALLTSLLDSNPDAVVIGSIGTISYDMTHIPHNNKILIRGAMGAAVGFGLGYALYTDKKVLVFVGDGSLLMKAGMLSTVAAHQPKNLEIHVLNNNSYKSCGGQPTNFAYLGKEINVTIHEV